MSQGTEFHGRGTAPAHPGRHRRGGAESWTPPLPQHRPVRHHAAGGAPEPLRHHTPVVPVEGGVPSARQYSGVAPDSGFRPRPQYSPGADRDDGFSPLPHHGGGPAPAHSGGIAPDGSQLWRYSADSAEGALGDRAHPLRRYPDSHLSADSTEGPRGDRPHTLGHYPGSPAFTEGAPGDQPHLLRRYPGSSTFAGTTEAIPGGGFLPLPNPTSAGPAMAAPQFLRHHGVLGEAPGQEVDSRPFRGLLSDSALGDPPVSGLLPLPQPRDPRPSAPLFPAAHGSLTLGERAEGHGGDLAEDEAEAPATESHAEQAARRTRVSLAAPAPQCVDLDEDDVRIYSAPPIDGLGGFTIGSVPASVTPPKTWKKAAWFATGASGAVVVGLLCAGSFLVGKPPMDQAVQGSWPGYQGVPTVADPTGEHRPPTQGGSAAGPEKSASPTDDTGTPQSGGGAGPVDGVPRPPAAEDTGAAPETATTGTGTTRPATTTAAVPRKPPVTPAQRETPVKSPWWYSFPPDAQTMGDNSEKFFNTVTTDPSAASSVTTGRLHDQGPQALAKRYAGIAYFEVKKVSIDQQRGVTINTVEVTHTDGTKTVEERTLTFGDGDKITADGQ
ncbi:hypothetical protein [Amycolatopsis sp. lyj-23]|uniref:hypothetical protein n=1 Tax=Amycolatopsis sp. lyj-23 TaxID=2789283 RepID=UPI003978A005